MMDAIILADKELKEKNALKAQEALEAKAKAEKEAAEKTVEV